MTRHTLERTAIWTLDRHIKIPQIVIVRGSRYSGSRVCHKALRFLETVGGKGVCARRGVLLGSRTLIIRCNRARVEIGYGHKLDKTYLGKSHESSLSQNNMARRVSNPVIDILGYFRRRISDSQRLRQTRVFESCLLRAKTTGFG